MIRFLPLVFVAFFVLPTLALPNAGNAQVNWPEFRGPSADGKSTVKLPDAVDKNSIEWSTPIHGKGWSSPVVWGEQIWLTTATEDGKKMSLISVDLKTGKILSDQVLHENKEPAFCHPTNSYASPTPAIEEGRIYVHFGSYGTTCIDTSSGEQIWQRLDLECDHFRGPASSPILYKNLMIVALDGFDFQYVVALDKATGKTVWKTDREIDYGTDNGDLKKAYGTGAIFDVDGNDILVVPSAVATIAYDPLSGKPLWTVYHEGMNASARPVRGENGLVVISNGMGKMVGVNPVGSGDITNSNIKWTQTKGAAKKPSQIVIGNLLYMVSDKGIVSCLDLDTGKPRWQERVGGAFSASPVFDGEKILAVSEKGKVLIFKPNPDAYEEVSQDKIGEGFKASPAIVADRLILRGFSKLYCLSNQ